MEICSALQRLLLVIIVMYTLREGHAVVQSFKALRHKPEERGFSSRRLHWNFSIDKILKLALWLWVDSSSSINEYQEYFLWVKAASV
jgi:hypothetical protein